MSGRDVVVVGGSAGGVEALRELLAELPADLRASVLVVVHMPAAAGGSLATALAGCTALPVRPARDGERLVPGRVYVPVPDHHLLVRDGTVRLSRSPRQNRSRPAVDALFRSAARWYGARTIAVMLSGAGDDGAAGASAILALGGVVAVQDPADALVGGMPLAVLAAVRGDAYVDTAAGLGPCVAALTEQSPTPRAVPLDGDLIMESDQTEPERVFMAAQPATPAGLGCPDCGGGISVVGSDTAVHFRCHVGHSYSPESYLSHRTPSAWTWRCSRRPAHRRW